LPSSGAALPFADPPAIALEKPRMTPWRQRFAGYLCGMLLVLLAAAHGSVAYAQNQAPAQSDAPALKPEEIEALVAPIALYPDDLLSQVLMASTYPLEIVQAARWRARAGT
jgi:hypothetical protein